MRESKIESHLVKQVKRIGGTAKKMKNRNDPDRLVLLPCEQMHFIELKAPGKSARPGQEREHARLWKLGFRVLVLDTIEKVDAFIKRVA